MAKLRKFTDTIRSTKKFTSQDTNSEKKMSGEGVAVPRQLGSRESAVEETEEAAEAAEGADAAVTYHGQVLEEDERGIDPEREKLELQNWFVGKLKCKKHIDDKYRNGSSGSSSGGGGNGSGSDGRYVDDYAVIDPRASNR